MSARRVLIVEDNEEDFRAILRAFDRIGADVAIARATDGDEALESMRSAAIEGNPLPEIVLLDLSLPGTDGRETLAEMKGDDWLRAIPVIVLSTSSSPQDVADCYRHGVSGYCVKPIDRVKFDETIAAIYTYWVRSVTLPERVFLG